MRVTAIYLILLSTVGLAAAEWVYEGEWGGVGGQGISVAPNGRVYVLTGEDLIQYYTPTGSFLGSWSSWLNDACNLAVGPSRTVYVTEGTYNRPQVLRFTATGSLLNTWWCDSGYLYGVDASPSDNVYVTSARDGKVFFYSSAGSFLGSWGSGGTGNGQFNNPLGIAITQDSKVYVADVGNDRVQYFTSTGSFLGKWFTGFLYSGGIAVAPDGDVFVTGTNQVREFTSAGSLISIFASPGAAWLAVSPAGERVYVTDWQNGRVIYYRESEPAVTPASLGRVKALFR